MNAIGKLHVLIVDDSEDDAILLAEMLREGGLHVVERCVDTPQELQKEIRGHKWDIVLCDNNMPELDAASAFDIVSRHHPAIPFIIVSGDMSEEAASDVMRLGASDYISKQSLSRLVPAVERELRRFTHNKESQNLADCIQLVDDLNASLCDETVVLVLVEMCRYRDFVRQAQEKELMEAFSDQLVKFAIRERVWRLREDLFALTITTESDELRSNVREIVDSFKAPLHIDEEEWFVNCKVGASAISEKDGAKLLQQAEAALQCAREVEAPAAVCFYHPGLEERAWEKLEMERALSHAILNEEFELFYQPQFDLSTCRIVGAEALLRWRRNGNLISPAEFIPVLEETGMILRVGEWVLRKACEVNRGLQLRGLPTIRMAVNLSAIQFRQPGLPEKVSKALLDSGLEPGHLTLEITENIALHNGPEILSTLNQLKAMGIQLALDDFGTGYSSLSYLKDFPIDKLKIDQSFVKDIALNKSNEAIVTAIVLIAKSLDLEVIAEGVETAEQAEILRACGCLEVQGYHFCRPISEEAFKSFLESR
jgi:diguanylate cyclase